MAALVSAVAALAGTAPAASADHGITLLASQRLDSRLLDLTLSTRALGTPTHVRVLLPAAIASRSPGATRCSTYSMAPSTTIAPGQTRAPSRASPDIAS